MLLISRGLGSGVLFAAARAGKGMPEDLDSALVELALSQHMLVESLFQMEQKNNGLPEVHACTDITGFGLLGHLEEMLVASNSHRAKKGLPGLRMHLIAELIPSFKGALSLLGDGYSSTLSPSNRKVLGLLENVGNRSADINLILGDSILYGSKEHYQIKELIVDPQTCGPLVIACSSEVALQLASHSKWVKIGTVDHI